LKKLAPLLVTRRGLVLTSDFEAGAEKSVCGLQKDLTSTSSFLTFERLERFEPLASPDYSP
jgi:hypothetical protein